MYHYVYLLIHPIDRRRYIGLRSSTVLPTQDTKYKSSCKVVSKEYLLKCKKRVLRIFNSRTEAAAFEVYLHHKYNVGVNPRFFNGAKQTSTKFDQSGLIHAKNNPNAHTIYIFNHVNELQYELNGELTNWTVDAPRYAFVKSHKNNGLRLGLTESSRAELRKRNHQAFIGWYALKTNTAHTDQITAFDPVVEQKIGAHSVLSLRKLTNNKGATNPNAKYYEFFDNTGKLRHTVHGNLRSFVTSILKIGMHTVYKAIKDKQPIDGGKPSTRHLKGWTIIKKEFL